jgi:phosphate transport system ATP-binding protein
VSLTPAVTVVLVTNNVKQAERVADRTSFFLMGELVETAPTATLFAQTTARAHTRLPVGRFG